MPSLLQLVDIPSAAPPELKSEGLYLLAALVGEHDVGALSAPIVQALARALDGPCKAEVLHLLCILALRLDART